MSSEAEYYILPRRIAKDHEACTAIAKFVRFHQLKNKRHWRGCHRRCCSRGTYLAT